MHSSVVIAPFCLSFPPSFHELLPSTSVTPCSCTPFFYFFLFLSPFSSRLPSFVSPHLSSLPGPIDVQANGVACSIVDKKWNHGCADGFCACSWRPAAAVAGLCVTRIASRVHVWSCSLCWRPYSRICALYLHLSSRLAQTASASSSSSRATPRRTCAGQPCVGCY